LLNRYISLYMPFKLRFFVVAFLLLSQTGLGQDKNIPIGQWRLHTTYRYGKSLDIVNNKVYISCGKGSIYLDKSDLSITPLSKIEGLNDYSANIIKYNKALDILLLAYNNGNIDLLHGNTVTNISDIKRKILTGTKNINHVTFEGSYAYLSCDFGISVVDLKQAEIKETYFNIGFGGSPNKVYASAITADKDSIFIASDSGVMAAKLSPAVNLLDYNNWHTFRIQDSIPTAKVRSVSVLNDQMYAAVEDSGIYIFNGVYWKKTAIPITVGNSLQSMSTSAGKLIICTGPKIITYDGINYESISSWNIAFPFEALYDENGKLWIADAGYGLISDMEGYLKIYAPNGPYTDLAFKFHYYNNNIVSLTGGYTRNGPIGLIEGYYIFNNQTWNSFMKYNTPEISSVKDLIDVAYNPLDGSLYIASYGYGLIERKSDGKHLVYNDTVPLPGGTFLTGTPGNIRIAGLAVDANGDLWIANRDLSSNQPTLFVKRLNGTSATYFLGGSTLLSSTNIVIDDLNNKWIRLSQSNGILVFNEKGSKTKFLTTGTGNGNLPHNDVTCLAKDKKGQMWVGTQNGIAVFNDASSVFSSGTFDASIPIYNQYPLLFQESIRCITVDGGNRKWVGTENGLWLFNDDGTQVINHFTTNNSPLLSDMIMDVGINALTGEVFIGTDQGIISYRGTATESTEEFSNVKVFPNPVPHNYNGLVGISGLATNSNVKITDIYGNLIFETHANGGTATWNVKDYNGRPAETGVYLIYAASSEGAQGFVSKVAVIK
jgi:hypothetical protein